MGHLAACWTDKNPFQIVMGTGHAVSFVVAHEAIREQWDANLISRWSQRYGEPGGDPTELLGWPEGVPHIFGELGPAIPVSQALAAGTTQPTVCIVGDGECETPVALAAMAHADVLFDRKPARWLLAVNANGARMGSTARFSSNALRALLLGMGYEVVTSNEDSRTARLAAFKCWQLACAYKRVAWISSTPKGWPAPPVLAGRPFRGHAAHKIPTGLRLSDRSTLRTIHALQTQLAEGTLSFDGKPVAGIAALAARASFRTVRSPAAKVMRVKPNRLQRSTKNARQWLPPIAGVAEFVCKNRVQVFCPDEARSNGFSDCVAMNIVTEVLAEEVCFGWAIGTVESGAPAIFSTYEAFSPLIASQLGQYAKLRSARPNLRYPPLGVVSTSLGWANSPSHQNSDLVGSFVARPFGTLRLICPVGKSSARRRIAELHSTDTDIYCIVCSKQDLPDLPDPGGSVVFYSIDGYRAPEAGIIAVGDVCVTEAVAAMLLARQLGRTIEVIAIIDPMALDREGQSLPDRLVGSVWCAPNLLAGILWPYANRIIDVCGYREAAGATPWETLRRNSLDRYSLLSRLLPDLHSLHDDEGHANNRMIPRFDFRSVRAERRIKH